MVRYGDQEQSSPGGTQQPLGTPQAPLARTPAEPGLRDGASAPDKRGGEARLAGPDGARQVPHPRPARRPALFRRPESLRAIPSLARFLTQASREPGAARPGRGRPARATADGQDDSASRDTAAAQDASASLDRGFPGRAVPASAFPDGAAGRDTGADPETAAGWGGRGGPGLGTDRARAGPPGRAQAPESTAAELRDLSELSELLTELAGLVHDLGALIVGLMTAATGAGDGDRQVRTFTIPPELAELAGAHQELKTGQEALTERFKAAGSHQERAALRASLAALTERATRAVSAAAAAVTPEEVAVVPAEVAVVPAEVAVVPAEAAVMTAEVAVAPQDVQPSGRPLGETTPPGESGSQSGAPLREETGVPSTTGETPARGPVRWGDASASDRRLAPVAVALDAPDIDVAARWATLVTPYVSTVKIGLELYLRYGPAVVATVRGGSGVHVFLDLKLHDIPNTVAGAARAVSKLRPEILTVHAAGGADMIKAAVEAAPDTIVAGVTLLTSMGAEDLAELGIEGSVSDAVRRMAALAVAAGARGLVCSPREVAAVRAEVGPGILLITPGIRPAGATSDDQARVATPEEALKAGADLLVIGRPITKSPDPGAAAAAIAGSLRRAVPAT
jgi:orotidine-5'-phosphate decarboxylase